MFPSGVLSLCILGAMAVPILSSARGEALGSFERQADIGNPKRSGSAAYDAERDLYTVSGGGRNMWSTNDAFHFVWKQVSGDVALEADIAFPETGGDPHRKACLLFRQGPSPGAAYADAALHGDGLTSLQYRETANGPTREIQSNVRGPVRLRLERRGNYVSMFSAESGGSFHPAGGSFRLNLTEPFQVGLGVCAHNDDRLETAHFSHVRIVPLPPPVPGQKLRRISTLETVTIASKDRRVTWWTTNLIEAPNWLRDGTNLLFNSAGKLWRIPQIGGVPTPVDTGFAIRNNNDHGVSPDGSRLVISDQSQPDRKSRIYTLPISGGTPVPVVEAAPSYWHGWSPDGQTLAYCAERMGEFDIYTVPVGGGPERRLTTSPGLDDGPDYSPDGAYIYFNSARSGRMQIWRMKPDGSGQEPVTRDDANHWFPHPSPDGKWLVFLTYDAEVQGHPENKDVQLRLLSLADGKTEVLAKLFGGQGTINVPSWSPDSRKLAFVSYQLLP